MPTLEESVPLNGVQQEGGHRDQKIALGATSASLLFFSVVCLPSIVSRWHPSYYAALAIEQGGWTWLGVNSLLLAVALVWTLFHLDNGPCVATACLLSVLIWTYMDVVLISQAIRGMLSLVAIADFVVQTVLLGLCARAAWGGVASHTHKTRSDGSDTWRRVLRKWILVTASLQLFVAFVVCWPNRLPLTATVDKRESAPWEFNSGIVFVMMLAVLWGAFLARGGLVDDTKRAMCAWCALLFLAYFVLCSFSWPALGLTGHSVITSVLIAADVCVLTTAALV